MSSLCKKLAASESRLAESERKVGELAEMQSQRWGDFCKMADNMKNLSSNMLHQSQTNKNIDKVV